MGKIFAGFKDYFQTARLIITPLILATPAVCIWHFLYLRGWHSTALADEPVVNAILPGLFGAHIFIATLMILRETDDIRKMKRAIKTEDKDGFLEIAEDSIPTPMKYVLLTTATFIECWTISLNYELYWTGLASVYSVGYFLSLIWEIIADFDDPINGMWVISGVPSEWLKDSNIKRRISDKIFEKIIKKFKTA